MTNIQSRRQANAIVSDDQFILPGRSSQKRYGQRSVPLGKRVFQGV